jgi:hypothetical protein
MFRQIERSLTTEGDDEELPWCSICNEDAAVRCTDCEGDIYCKRCFQECHAEFEMDHTAVNYTKKSPEKK